MTLEALIFSLLPPPFSPMTCPKPYNTSVCSKMLKITFALDSSKSSGPHYIPVMVLNNCESEPSYIWANLFEGILFPKKCWKVSSVIYDFKNVMKRSVAKTDILKTFFPLLAKSVKRSFFWFLIWFQVFFFNCRCVECSR